MTRLEMPHRRVGAVAGVVILAAALVGGTIVSTAHEGHDTPWVAPESENDRANPIARSAESTARGRALYERHCRSCHGQSGRGDGPVAKRLGYTAGNLTDAAQMNSQTDGAIFWKIATGREPMPAFRKDRDLTDDQIWDLVNYARGFVAGAQTRPRRD